MNIKDIEQDLIKACDTAIKEGWKIIPSITMRAEQKTCCALGAVCVMAPNTYELDFGIIARLRYGMSCNNTGAFVDAFDGLNYNKFGQESDQFFQMGERLRKRYL